MLPLTSMSMGELVVFTLSESNTLFACLNTVSTCPQSGYFRKYSHRNTESIDLFNVFRRTVNPKWKQDILRKKYPYTCNCIVMFMYQLMILMSPPFCVLKNWALSRDFFVLKT